MSGLANILLDCGVRVSGSDASPSAALRHLQARGATVAVGHHADNLPAAVELLVHSSAVSPTNPELLEATARGLPSQRRGAFLAELARAWPTVVAVAGSHGKTTTTAMIAHILRQSGRRPGFLIGGQVAGWSQAAAAGRGQILVTEVDESDGTQALLASQVAVVVNIEDDHCWSLGGLPQLEQCFADFAARAAQVVAWDTPKTREVLATHPAVAYLSVADDATDWQLQVGGAHNRVNATLAVAAAAAVGVPRAVAWAAVASFPGVERRLSVRYRSPDGQVVVVEDYAHHPTELAAALAALREGFPAHRLLVVFQPHRFERIKRYGEAFARRLENADEVVVYDAFAAWVADTELADARSIAAAVAAIPCQFWNGSPEALAEQLAEKAGSAPTVVAVVGAGDVTRLVEPLRACLSQACLAQFAAELAQLVPDSRVATDIPWRRLTTLGVGSACPVLIQPANLADLADAIRLAAGSGLGWRALGVGSNVVGSDAPQLDLIVQLDGPEFAEFAIGSATTRAGGGCSLRSVLLAMLEAGHLPARLAPLAWIPGTVGGAVRMNAGAAGVAIGELVAEVAGLRPDGTLARFAAADLVWRYRGCNLPAELVIVEVVLKHLAGDAPAGWQAYEQHDRWRREHHPGGRTAGSVFRNAGPLAAGQLLERCGLKGCRQGGCRFSEQHANFIVTEAGAGEDEIVQLVCRARLAVAAQTGIHLATEVVFMNAESTRRIQECLRAPVVAVLMGGPSKERQVSLSSGAAVVAALRQAGYAQIHEIDFADAALPEIPADTEVVFPVLHGRFGEDGQLQALLEAAGWPYVGSGPTASRIAMVKSETKELLLAEGIPTARYQRLTSATAPMPTDLRWPLIVKPDSQGSSFGLSKLEQPDEQAWRQALAAAFAVDEAVLVEEFVAGREITVGILHGQALPVIEIVPPAGRTFDFDAKYAHLHGDTEYLCPPRQVSAAAQELAANYATQFFRAIGAKDMLRVDFIVDQDDLPWCLEGNSIPGFTATSLLPKAAAAAGIAFPELCARLVANCL